MVDINTGEITIDRGFFRKARTLEFGATAAPDDVEHTDSTFRDEFDVQECGFIYILPKNSATTDKLLQVPNVSLSLRSIALVDVVLHELSGRHG